VLLTSVNGRFSIDEFEHIHSAWYVRTGHVPYSDFFQHHNPLLWYVMAPFLWVFGHTVGTVMVFRFLMFIFTLGIAYLAYSISRALTDSTEAGLFSVLLLLSMRTFVGSTVEIRPDVPMVLFGLFSIYYLVKFLQTNENRRIILCGLFASISLLFLQKMIFLLFAYAAIFAYQLSKKRISAKDVLHFCISFLAPQIALAGYLMITGSFRDYILANWLVNVTRDMTNTHFGLSLPLAAMRFPRQTRVFWTLCALAVALIFRDKKTSVELKTVAFICVVLFLSLSVYRRLSDHYFIFAISALCVVVGCFLKIGFDNLKLAEPPRMLLMLLVIFIPAHLQSREIDLVSDNDLQLEKADFVLANSEDCDLVYDGYNQFNLYRRDLHYFWYALGKDKSFGTYNMLTNNKYGDYDICELIRSKKPKFISDYDVDISGSGLAELYCKTRFDGLYIRKAER
jgi:4-amino-4-deoxy-L-arabinose transferase-like glycosyltransferase